MWRAPVLLFVLVFASSDARSISRVTNTLAFLEKLKLEKDYQTQIQEDQSLWEGADWEGSLEDLKEVCLSLLEYYSNGTGIQPAVLYEWIYEECHEVVTMPDPAPPPPPEEMLYHCNYQYEHALIISEFCFKIPEDQWTHDCQEAVSQNGGKINKWCQWFISTPAPTATPEPMETTTTPVKEPTLEDYCSVVLEIDVPALVYWELYDYCHDVITMPSPPPLPAPEEIADYCNFDYENGLEVPKVCYKIPDDQWAQYCQEQYQSEGNANGWCQQYISTPAPTMTPKPQVKDWKAMMLRQLHSNRRE